MENENIPANVAENAALPAAQEAEATQPAPAPEGAAQSLAQLSAQLAQARAAYAGLDIKKEMQEPQFARLLRAGVPIKDAYEFIHREEMLESLVGGVARNVRARVLRDVQARGARPAENGTAGRASAMARETLPSEWSREERERIGREALRGVKHPIQI